MYLNIRELSFQYGKSSILSHITFSASRGSVVGLLGPNGVGKTTLIKCIGGMLPVKQGEIILDNRNLIALSPRERARMVGYVPQNVQASMSARVLDIVMMGRIPYLRFSPSALDRKIVFAVLDRLTLNDLAFREFDQLSGGERQRVLLGRALVQQPQLLLLDEPISNLDMKYQRETIRIIREYAAEHQITVVVSIHDLNLSSLLCDKILLFQRGSCYAQGTCSEVLTAENILEVYGVETEIWERNGCRQILLAK